MLLADEMAHVGFIVDIELLTVLAILGITLIDGLVIVPARNLTLGIFFFEQGMHTLLQ